MEKNFVIKDSGKRETFSTGMNRDVQNDKPRFDLIVPLEIPYENQMLTRFAAHLSKGANKYGERNWEIASTIEELMRFKASAFRHFMQWLCGVEDEDHASATWFNMQGTELVKYKIGNEFSDKKKK